MGELDHKEAEHQDAWGWCTGMAQRDGTGRKVGGGFRMRNTRTPVVDSCWCMAKQIQYCKIKKKRSWAPQSWSFQVVVLEKTLRSPLNCKEIKLVNPKGNQPWIFTGRTDTEAEAPILGPPNEKSWLTGKDPDSQKDWRQKEKGVAEDEMVR